MTRLTEQHDVQDQLINTLIGLGWRYLPPGDVMVERGQDEHEPFLPGLARQKLVELNPGLVTAENADDVLRQLRGVRADLGGNENFLRALRGGWTVYDPGEKRERNLALVKFDDPAANDFTFTQEFVFTDRDRRRLDMVLFVNGLPVAVVENKSPTIQDPEIKAFEQVQETYTGRIPEFLKFVQFFAAADTRLHYGPTWNNSLKAFYTWKWQGRDYGLAGLCRSLLGQGQVLDILRDYLIFFRADDQTQKYVLRPHQMRAVDRIAARVTGQEADTGLVWHTQGSGKTLTMIVAAHRLRRAPELENPTLLIVVDRRELAAQMEQNLEAFGFPMVSRARSKRHLEKLLASDYRGLIVTLIHKFERIEKDLNPRRNIIVFIDEAHRSQEGDLAIFMRAALPNAMYFGFTGTPVNSNKIGKGTFNTFGKPDPDGYLDKYGIDESIQDRTTVPLYYTLAPAELRLDRATLEEEFFKLVEENDVASIEELNRLLDRADKLKAVLKAPERVAGIARHVAAHFRANVAPLGFKVFLVAVDREACALYQEALQKHLPPEYSRVVYTANHKDVELLRRYHLDDDAEKKVRKNFRDPDSLPKILIVTEKLLTGYDAPVLYAMYLDKPVKDHTLLQAIARVNRPYPDKKSGLVVDYIGIFEDLQRALAFDQASVSQALLDLELLREQFAGLMTKLEASLAPIDLSGNTDDRSARIIEHFAEPGRRDGFTADFRVSQTAYEVLAPDPFLRDYLDRYGQIAQIYQVICNQYDPETQRRKLRHDLLNKTDALIRANVELVSLAQPLPLYPINRDLAKVIAADNLSDQVKVINLYRSLMAHIEENQAGQPYLVSIGDEVESVIQRLRDRQISARAALEQMEAGVEKAIRGAEAQQASSLDGKAFAYRWILQGYGLPDAEAKAAAVAAILERYPNWPYNPRQAREVRLALYGTLREEMEGQPGRVRESRPGYEAGDPAGSAAARVKELVDNLLKMHRTVMG